MAEISINEDRVAALPDYTTGTHAADAAQNLFECLHKLVSVHGGTLSIENHPHANTFKVIWDGGPKQWAHSYAATLDAKHIVVAATSCQSVAFSNLH